MFLDEPFQFGVGDVIYEILAHEGDCLPFKRCQSRCHLDRLYGRESHRAHYIVLHGARSVRVARVVTLETVGLRPCRAKGHVTNNGECQSENLFHYL